VTTSQTIALGLVLVGVSVLANAFGS